MNLPEAIAVLIELANRDRPRGLFRDSDAARVIVEALKTRDGAKACTEHVWAEIGEPEHAERKP